ncbi:MAG: hypothetical protein ACREN3_11850, partial [Gemmatimonadaceae bacterium]
MISRALVSRRSVLLALSALCVAVGALALASAPALAVTGPPVVAEEAPSDVGPASAALNAMVEPGELPTTYSFEYGTSTAYGSSTPEVKLAGEGSAAVATGPVEVRELAPETVYYFRVVVKNGDGEARGTGGTFRTFPSVSGLPDGRVYEMVTPVENHDASVYDPALGIENVGEYDSLEEVPFLVSPSGESVTYAGDPSPEGNGAAGGPFLANQYLASRSS